MQLRYLKLKKKMAVELFSLFERARKGRSGKVLVSDRKRLRIKNRFERGNKRWQKTNELKGQRKGETRKGKGKAKKETEKCRQKYGNK